MSTQGTGLTDRGAELGAMVERHGCPKRMVFGPCGGVRPDGRCEMSEQPCVFLEAPSPGWSTVSPERGARASPARLSSGLGRLVITDCSLPPYDRRAVSEIVELLAESSDALLLGEHHNRPDFPPTLLAQLVRAAGGNAIVTLTCRDRNRLVLEQELHGLAELGVFGVLCVTGDGRAHGVRPGVTQVFDLDGTRLAALAADTNVVAFVPESPLAPPVLQRPLRVLAKQDAGASVCILNHVSAPAEVRSFIDSCRDVGVTIPFIAAVAAFTDERSAAVLSSFPGLSLDATLVERVLDSTDSVSAGIEVAIEEAAALLSIPGVIGINISGLASAAGLTVAARIKASIAAGVRAL